MTTDGLPNDPRVAARSDADAGGATGHHIEVIYAPAEIEARIDELADRIVSAKLEPLLVIAVLKGSFIFAADLIRALHRQGLAPQVEFITLSSYKENVRSSGQVAIRRDIETDVRGRNILLVDDILETGRTLAFAKDLLIARGARSVSTCVLLEKPGKRSVEIEADYRAFVCPDVFVVGYGMDLAHHYRQLPFVGHIVHDKP